MNYLILKIIIYSYAKIMKMLEKLQIKKLCSYFYKITRDSYKKY